MQFQYDFRGGSTPDNTGFLVCPRCVDDLNFQRKLIIIPPDPPPLANTRPENYIVDESNWLTTQEGDTLTTQDGERFIAQIPNPAQVAATAHLETTIAYGLGSLPAACYLDIFLGDPAAGGTSVLAQITGSATRTNIVADLGTASGKAVNPDRIIVAASASAGVNLSYSAIYDAATSGTLLMSGPLNVRGPFVTAGNPVVFDALAITINL